MGGGGTTAVCIVECEGNLRERSCVTKAHPPQTKPATLVWHVASTNLSAYEHRLFGDPTRVVLENSVGGKASVHGLAYTLSGRGQGKCAWSRIHPKW